MKLLIGLLLLLATSANAEVVLPEHRPTLVDPFGEEGLAFSCQTMTATLVREVMPPPIQETYLDVDAASVSLTDALIEQRTEVYGPYNVILHYTYRLPDDLIDKIRRATSLMLFSLVTSNEDMTMTVAIPLGKQTALFHLLQTCQ